MNGVLVGVAVVVTIVGVGVAVGGTIVGFGVGVGGTGVDVGVGNEHISPKQVLLSPSFITMGK